jgi:branched-chain amino acid transport system ATP-binding protein
LARGDGASPAASVLTLDGLGAGYGRKQVVFDVSLDVGDGEIVGILGHNGSGKSTTIRTVLGLLKPMGGRVVYKDRDCTGRSPRLNVSDGMALIPSERFVFQDLSVTDNLLLGAANDPDPERRARRMELVLDLFPILAERASQPAGVMSGGQQRMVSLGIALMSSPKLLLLDEPSLGLAPIVTREIFRIVRELNEQDGLTVLVVEQNAAIALDVASHAYVLEVGKVAVSGTSAELARDESVRKSYLGY